MSRAFAYIGQYQSLTGRYRGLPSWARTIVGIFALPGILLIALSLVALLVSILALLLLTAPVYMLLSRLTSSSVPQTAPAPFEPMESGRRHVDVKVVE